MYAKVSDDTRALDELTDSLSEADSGGRLKLATQKFYFAGLVACIENLCLSPHGVSSIERSARMRDMLRRLEPVRWVAALKDNHRGLRSVVWADRQRQARALRDVYASGSFS